MTDQQEPAGTTSDRGALSGELNIGRPWPPRVDSCLVGGSEHYEADEELAERIAELVPWVRQSTWITKQHGTTAALILARELGIKQFIDLGCGYPSPRNRAKAPAGAERSEYLPPHTYDIVHTVHGADTRVVYADIDPSVASMADMWLADHPGVSAVRADGRDVPALLAHSGVLETVDLGQPVGILLHAVLEWWTDSEAARALQDLHDLLPAGSAVSLTHATGDDDPAGMAALANAYAKEGFGYRPRSRAAIESLLSMWEVLPPGLQPTARYRQDQPPPAPEHLRTTRKLPADASHTYAVATAPKNARPEPVTLARMLAGEPARPPGFLLVGATLRALREQSGIDVDSAAARLRVPPLALDLWESGSHRLADRVGAMLQALDVDDYDTERLLLRLLNHQAHRMWSSHLPFENEEFSDPFPGRGGRANAVLRAATQIRAFAFDRVPDAFQTPEYARVVPRDHLSDPAGGPHPAAAAPRAQDAQSCGWTLVLDESLLERTFGRTEVLAEQLGYLLDLGALPHITLRVLRLDSTFAMPVASLTEHTLAGGVLWRVNGSVYRGLSRGDSCRLLMDQALANAESEAASRQLLEQARERTLATTVSPSRPAESASARDA
ncbi:MULTISPECIES: Scr1 family TA system antitoxin-like transcriptional regulator [unclassified Streptomyces]|uniref:Scr1 family TA system antitoxin-like transcriptional regulator n=1 Tax=unclassified Streptomyces TaxID=2593676 RepID=UPI00379B9EBF